MMRVDLSRLHPTGRKDALWVLSFEPAGQPWVTGAFRPNRERELIEAGVLVPVPGRPGAFTTAAEEDRP